MTQTLDRVLSAQVPRSGTTRAAHRGRLVGTPLRGLAFLLVAAALVSITVLLLAKRTSGALRSDAWVFAGLAVLLAACAPLAIGIEELRRPLRRFRGRTRGKGVSGGDGPAWHPRLRGVVDEYRRTTQLNEARPGIGISPVWVVAGGVASAIDEALSPRLTARVVFPDGPLRTGSVARVDFSGRLSKGRIDGGFAEFRLLCFRERPDVILPGRGLECLADLSPVRRRDRREDQFDAHLEFRIDEDLPPSDLTAPLPTYWLLAVTIDGLAGPYGEEFYVPVASG